MGMNVWFLRVSRILVTCISVCLYSAAFASAIELPQTGQRTCYSQSGSVISCTGTGQDGDRITGAQWPDPRFTVSGACITDNLTGLMWVKALDSAKMTWQQALDLSNNLSLCGYEDWRLPNVSELLSLVNAETSDSITYLASQGFAGLIAYYYWTSTSAPSSPISDAVSITLRDGEEYRDNKSTRTNYALPVRDGISGAVQLSATGQTTSYSPGDDGDMEKGAPWPSPRFTNNLNGTVTDNLTGLIWLRNAACADTVEGVYGGRLSWNAALLWSNGLADGNCGLSDDSRPGDWRLPNVTELMSLSDMSRIPAYPPVHPFTALQNFAYWSSTTAARYPGSAWCFEFSGAQSRVETKADDGYSAYYVLPVKGGQSWSFAGLTVTKTGSGSGGVTSDPAGIDCGNVCSHQFNSGKQIILTAVPGAGSEFGGWFGCDSDNGGQCTVAINGNKEVAAFFAPAGSLRTLNVTKTGSGSGGVTSNPAGIDCGNACSALFTIDTQTVLTATPDISSVFSLWSGCDSVNGSLCTVDITGNKDVSADFSIKTFSITPIVAGGSGAVTCNNLTVNYGGNSTCQITPAAGSHITDVMIDGVSRKPPPSSYYFAAIKASHTISASFEEDSYSLEVTKNGGGSGSITLGTGPLAWNGNVGTATCPPGTDVVLTAAADSGSELVGWQGCDSVLNNGTSCLVRNTDGAVEEGFSPSVNSSITAIVFQPDRKILIGGNFTSVNGQTRHHIARLNPDGSLDDAFNPDADYTVYAIAIQADGKILIGGNFTLVGGQTRRSLARLNADGTLDPGFDPDINSGSSTSYVFSIASQPDGKILAGGNYDYIGTQEVSNLARLNPDGTIDSAFTLANHSHINSIVLQPDGKIIIGDYNGLKRLKPDGAYDPGFGSVSADWSGVQDAALQSDGKIIAAGDFKTLFPGISRNSIARILANGSVDSGYNPSVHEGISSVAIQPDNKVLIGGYFDSVGGSPYHHLARLNTDGYPDTPFCPSINDSVYSVAVQSDGKVVVGGNFTSAGGKARNRLARFMGNLRRVAATFTKPAYTLTVNKAGSGTGNVTAEPGPLTWTGATATAVYANATPATIVSLSAQPQTDTSAFDHWEGACVGNATVCDITMDADRSVMAYFSASADFSASPLSGGVPLSVNFTDLSVNNPIAWAWTFGDGVTSTQQDPAHRYNAEGTYSVTLAVSDGSVQRSVTKTAYITVGACGHQQVRVGSSGNGYNEYGSIMAAYNAAQSGETVEVREGAFSGELVFGSGADVTLNGGFDCGYGANEGYYTTVGNLTFSGGSVQLKNIVIR